MGAGASAPGYGQIAGMAAGFVGGQLQGWAALLDRWAMEDEYRRELQRQGEYRNQAATIFNAQLGQAGSAGAQQQLRQAYASRLGEYNSLDNVPLGFSVKGQRSASPRRDIAAARMAGGQRAGLMKYGDWLQGQKMLNLTTGRELDQTTNFAGGTAGVYPYRMYQAQHTMDDLAEMGAAISSVGGALSGGMVNGPLQRNQTPPSPYMSQGRPGGGGQNFSLGNYIDSYYPYTYQFPSRLPNQQYFDMPDQSLYGSQLVVG